MSSAKDETKATEAEPKLEDHLNMETFSQILEMDEPDDHEFSQSIVYGFFDQAETTFEEMDTAGEEKDLEKLSSLGHFLKGSSATIGLFKVRDGCEKIQRYGKKEKLDGTPGQDADECLRLVVETIADVKVDIADAHRVLDKYYKEKEGDGE